MRFVLPGGVSHGPDITYYQGRYTVTVKGKGLSSAAFSCTYDSGDHEIPLENLEVSDESASFNFYCDADYENGEILVKNDSENEIEIDSIDIRRN